MFIGGLCNIIGGAGETFPFMGGYGPGGKGDLTLESIKFMPPIC
jgi:hypothetical protein